MGSIHAPVRAPVRPASETGPADESHAAVTETHISVIVLIGDRAYKMRKCVQLPFLDLSTRQARLADCRREVELNRRLAPDVYLGVDLLAPLGSDADGATTPRSGEGEPVVVMRRMPWSRRLTTLLAAEGASERMRDVVRDVARQVATLHAGEAPVHGYGLTTTMTRLWREGHAQLAGFEEVLASTERDEVLALAEEYLAGRAGLLDRREQAGLVRDGHGDLLADDIFCLDDGPRILDCLEFDARLRLGDVLADLAFLAMDLTYRGAPGLARLLVDTYRQLDDEHHPRSLEHHYIGYRAFVRAKVDCLRHAQGDPDAANQARAHLDLCRTALRRGRVHLVLLGGLPGTGKSTLARALADADPDRQWAVLSSDEVRKELAGLGHGTVAAAPFRTGIYGPEHTATTYDELLRRAGTALADGVGVVLDASWTDAGLRRRARELAGRHHAAMTEVCCVAPAAVCRERLAARTAPLDGGAQRPAHGSASDADVSVHEAMAAVADPWSEAVSVPTSGGVAESVTLVLDHLAAASGPATRPGRA